MQGRVQEMSNLKFFIKLFLPNIVLSFAFLPLILGLFGIEHAFIMFIIGILSGIAFTFGAYVGLQWASSTDNNFRGRQE
jgi:tryptophan-rich sensory protein